MNYYYNAIRKPSQQSRKNPLLQFQRNNSYYNYGGELYTDGAFQQTTRTPIQPQRQVSFSEYGENGFAYEPQRENIYYDDQLYYNKNVQHVPTSTIASQSSKQLSYSYNDGDNSLLPQKTCCNCGYELCDCRCSRLVAMDKQRTPKGQLDVYRKILGPTPDETILAGLQTVIDMVCPTGKHGSQKCTCSSPSNAASNSNNNYGVLTVVPAVNAESNNSQTTRTELRSPTEVSSTEDEFKTVFPSYQQNYCYPNRAASSTSSAKNNYVFPVTCKYRQPAQTAKQPAIPAKDVIARRSKPVYTKYIQTIKSSLPQNSKAVQTCKYRRYFKLKQVGGRPVYVANVNMSDLSEMHSTSASNSCSATELTLSKSANTWDSCESSLSSDFLYEPQQCCPSSNKRKPRLKSTKSSKSQQTDRYIQEHPSQFFDVSDFRTFCITADASTQSLEYGHPKYSRNQPGGNEWQEALDDSIASDSLYETEINTDYHFGHDIPTEPTNELTHKPYYPKPETNNFKLADQRTVGYVLEKYKNPQNEHVTCRKSKQPSTLESIEETSEEGRIDEQIKKKKHLSHSSKCPVAPAKPSANDTSTKKNSQLSKIHFSIPHETMLENEHDVDEERSETLHVDPKTIRNNINLPCSRKNFEQASSCRVQNCSFLISNQIKPASRPFQVPVNQENLEKSPKLCNQSNCDRKHAVETLPNAVGLPSSQKLLYSHKTQFDETKCNSPKPCLATCNKTNSSKMADNKADSKCSSQNLFEKLPDDSQLPCQKSPQSQCQSKPRSHKFHKKFILSQSLNKSFDVTKYYNSGSFTSKSLNNNKTSCSPSTKHSDKIKADVKCPFNKCTAPVRHVELSKTTFNQVTNVHSPSEQNTPNKNDGLSQSTQESSDPTLILDEVAQNLPKNNNSSLPHSPQKQLKQKNCEQRLGSHNQKKIVVKLPCVTSDEQQEPDLPEFLQATANADIESKGDLDEQETRNFPQNSQKPLNQTRCSAWQSRQTPVLPKYHEVSPSPINASNRSSQRSLNTYMEESGAPQLSHVLSQEKLNSDRLYPNAHNQSKHLNAYPQESLVEPKFPLNTKLSDVQNSLHGSLNSHNAEMDQHSDLERVCPQPYEQIKSIDETRITSPNPSQQVSDNINDTATEKNNNPGDYSKVKTDKRLPIHWLIRRLLESKRQNFRV